LTKKRTFAQNFVNMLARNLKYLRKKRGKTQEQISAEVEISRNTWASYESGQSEPNVGIFKKLADYFQVNIEDLLLSELDSPLFDRRNTKLPNLKNDHLRVLPISTDPIGKNNIQFVPVSAQAGYSVGYSETGFIENCQHFNLPKHETGTYRAFEIVGDSMPPIHEGFIVIGQFVENWKSLTDGGRYILALREEGIVFKRVVCEAAKTNRIVLFSDNPEYLPFSVPLEDILEAWELTSFIGFPSKRENALDMILETVQKLDHQISRQFEPNKGKKK
jgi:transcriptional regulator with XRE-family HTH domain